MKTLWTIAAMGFVLVLIASAEAQETAKKLVGVWELVKGSGPPGATIEFKADGKMIMTAKVKDKILKMEGTYKVDGKKVIATYKVGDKEINNPATIEKLTDTQLITVDEKGEKDEYKKAKSK